MDLDTNDLLGVFQKLENIDLHITEDVLHSFSLEELDKTRWPFKFNMCAPEMAESLRDLISLLKKEDLNNIPLWMSSLIILKELKKQ